MMTTFFMIIILKKISMNIIKLNKYKKSKKINKIKPKKIL